MADNEYCLRRLAICGLVLGSQSLCAAQYQDSPDKYSITISEATQYYEMSTGSSGAFLDALTTAANLLTYDGLYGGTQVGESRLNYSFRYASVYDSDLGTCVVGSASMHFHFTTILPRLAEPVPQHLLQQWETFQAIVFDHEAEHQRIYRRAIRDFPEALDRVGPVPCTQLDNRVRAALSAAEERIETAGKDFDELSSPELYLAASAR